MDGITEHLLGTIVMSGADRDQPMISVPIYEFLNVAIQCSLQ